MQFYAEIIVAPEEFCKKNVVKRDVLICKGDTALITGTVYNEEREVVEGALVLVRSIGHNLEILQTIGYVISNDAGRFAFLVMRQLGINYLMEVYEPITDYYDKEEENVH